MRCNCCRAEVTQFNGQCPVCGFPMLTGGDIDIEAFVRRYREKKLRGVRIFLKTYSYEETDRVLCLSKVDYVPVAEALSLPKDEILWLNMEFEPIELDRPVSLDVCVQKDDERREYTVSASPSDVLRHEAIGVKECDGFSVQFAVGSKTSYALSERVPLL